MGYANVDQMLGEMTWKQVQEWIIYDQLDPFEPERADRRSAQIAQALWNIARDTKAHPNGWPLEDFVLHFGDDAANVKPPQKQSLETQELLIDAWIAGSNAVFEAQKCPPTSA